MSKVLIVGDLHGSFGNLFTHVKMCQNRGIDFDAIIQVGDFGIYPGSVKPLLSFTRKLGKPIHFIDGNHEHHGYLFNSYKKWISSGLIYHPRGDILEIGGRKIGFFGGALNVDIPQELWTSHMHRHNALDGIYNSNFKEMIVAQNFPSSKEVQFGIQQFNSTKIDLLVTHTCPALVGVGMIGTDFFKDTIKLFIHDQIDARVAHNFDVGDFWLTDLWNGLINKPSAVCYGHFHKYSWSRVGTTDFLCCGYSYNVEKLPITQPVIIYDTETNKIMI